MSVSYTHIDVYKRQVGYRASKAGKKLTLNLGYSHPVEMEDPEGLESEVQDNTIIIKGLDKEKVGQYAAEIRDKRRPEPYKGKGIKYADEAVSYTHLDVYKRQEQIWSTKCRNNV